MRQEAKSGQIATELDLNHFCLALISLHFTLHEMISQNEKLAFSFKSLQGRFDTDC